MKIPRLANRMARFLLTFYLFAALFKLAQVFVYLTKAQSLGIAATAFFQSMDFFLTGSTFWLLLRSVALLLSAKEKRSYQSHQKGEKVRRISQEGVRVLRWLEKYIRIFPFIMALLSIPEIFRLYQVLRSLGVVTNQTILGGFSIIIGGGLVALQIGFWYLVLRAVKVILELRVTEGV